MGSNMTNDQFIVQALNSLTSDYKLQMLLLEKQIGNKDNPLSIEELKEELNLRFERLSTSQNNNLGEESALFTSQFKGKCRNCGKLGHTQRNVSQSKLMKKNQMLCAIIARRAAI
jgi:hypothetical protein